MLSYARQTLFPVVILVICFATQLNAQQVAQTFSFRPGQSVYITALVHQANNPLDLSRGIVKSTALHIDLDYELRLRQQFESRKVFKLADKLSAADFVFLLIAEETNCEGLIISVDAYREFKGKEDFDALREAAYKRYLVGPYTFSPHKSAARDLSNKFHAENVR